MTRAEDRLRWSHKHGKRRHGSNIFGPEGEVRARRDRLSRCLARADGDAHRPGRVLPHAGVGAPRAFQYVERQRQPFGVGRIRREPRR